MIFDTRINGIPCQCQVLKFVPGRPMQVYGSGFGDAHPPEPPEFTYVILDRNGREAPWLQKYVTNSVEAQLFEEFELEMKDEYYNPY